MRVSGRFGTPWRCMTLPPPIVSHTGIEAVHAIGVMWMMNKFARCRSGWCDWCDVSTARTRIDLGSPQCHRRPSRPHYKCRWRDYAAIGTDYDGAIIPPADLADVTHHPLLVQDMLDRGWSEQRIQKYLGLITSGCPRDTSFRLILIFTFFFCFTGGSGGAVVFEVGGLLFVQTRP